LSAIKLSAVLQRPIQSHLSKYSKDTKSIKKLTRYMKIGTNNSGSGSTRTKVSVKPSSASRQDTHSGFVGNSGFLNQRRGSAMTTCSNNTSRYASIEDPKRKHLSSKDTIKIFSSVKKPKDTVSKTLAGMTGANEKKIGHNYSFNKSLSKNSLPGSLNLQLASNISKVNGDNGKPVSTAKKGNTSAVLLNYDSSPINKAKHLISTVSVASQSSTGTSTLSTIQGLKEINKVILSTSSNPRKELLSNRDNKVYSYKLNQLISIIKSSQSTSTNK
jgi:hypothetical protein